MPERDVIGWDIGGAHLKAARLRGGRVADTAQWPCPLWQGIDHLIQALSAAFRRWPDWAGCRHAVTMSGELVDRFGQRPDGVRCIAAVVSQAVPAPLFFAGDRGWCNAEQAAPAWSQVASANWLATARHAARALAPRSGVLLDIGSTTTDLIAFADGRVLTGSRSDLERLQRGELLYHGVVRTPLCALGPRVPWRGTPTNVMNEWFATTADVYRLTGQLDPAHDQQPSADGAAKDLPHTRARLARMIGLDAHDGGDDDWLALAGDWRQAQLTAIQAELSRVCEANALGDDAVIVGTGCGSFLIDALGRRTLPYAGRVAVPAADAAPALLDWIDVCAPAVAVAALMSGLPAKSETGVATTAR